MGALEQALELAFTGIPVFPCAVNKSPAIGKSKGGRGFLDASSDETEVRRLFGLVPKAKLVGVPTGPDSGFDVLDLDYRHGAGEWEMENAHRLPETRTHSTMNGGRHMLFQHVDGVRNSASKKELAPGVDVRGDGGYIIHPPSYGYVRISDAEIAPWPAWLLALVMKHLDEPRRSPSSGPSETMEISEKRLSAFADAVIRRVESAPEGAKHHTLRAAARTLGGIQVAAGFSDSSAIEKLIKALPSTAKDLIGARKTAAWGLEDGRKYPLELENRPQYTNGHAKTEGGPRPPEQQAPNSAPPRTQDHRKPVIHVSAGFRHQAADESLMAMTIAGTEFFQRDRSLVRAALAKAKTSDGAVVEIAGIIPVSNPMLGRAMGMSAEWEKSLKSGEIVQIDPPKEIVEQVAAMSGEWPFPPITGVISTPTLRPDGTLLFATGYDQMTGLVLISPPVMPPIPDRPTRVQAAQSLDMIGALLAEFPFADEASRSVAFSMILTTVLRGALLPTVPMHVATAPQPGTGKSFLADIASAVSTGERCPVIAIAPNNPEETEKRLIGAALAGQQIIALDNVSEMLTGDFLNQVTERPLMQLRPLGSSSIIRIANSFTVFANGNNLSAPADLVRRTLVCRLDANLENPEERQFKANPVREVLANRGLYVAACLTIGRAYIGAGSPGKCRTLASFDRWSDLVRSAIVWLGMPDPCSSMEMARAEDPIRAARAALFRSWEAEVEIGTPGMTTAQLIDEADKYDEGFLRPTFREACLAVAAERSGTAISPRRLGKWLSASNNNRVGELKLTVDRQDAARPRWILIKD